MVCTYLKAAQIPFPNAEEPFLLVYNTFRDKTDKYLMFLSTLYKKKNSLYKISRE